MGWRGLRGPVVVFAVLLLVGGFERFAIPSGWIDLERPLWQLILLQRELFLISGLGGLGLAAIAAWGGPRGEALWYKARLIVPLVLLGALLFLFAGEVAMRALFWGGTPFSGGGPIVRDFERGFASNRFDFEGRSRGPDYPGGDRLPPGPRVLVQGDSITWGAGVADENDLYTSRLRELLRRELPNAEVAALARSGREIDGHLRALERYGPELQPDAIVYQWYVNDLELDVSLRPRSRRWWRRSDIHRVLARHSYFWFFVDNRLDGLLPGPPVTYTDYMLSTFAEDSVAWEEFRQEFVRWAEIAKSLTPDVVVLLYPAIYQTEGFWPGRIHARVSELAERQGLTVIDFIDRCDAWKGDYGAMYASPYDRHPNEEVHRTMAEVVHDVVAPMLLREAVASGGKAPQDRWGTSATRP